MFQFVESVIAHTLTVIAFAAIKHYSAVKLLLMDFSRVQLDRSYLYNKSRRDKAHKIISFSIQRGISVLVLIRRDLFNSLKILQKYVDLFVKIL